MDSVNVSLSIERLLPSILLSEEGCTGSIPWRVCLFCYCNFIVLVYKGDLDHVSSFAKSLVVCCLGGFGGSLLNSALLGQVSPPLLNSEYVGCMALCWFLHHNAYFGDSFGRLLNDYVIGVGFEIFRCWVIFAWYDKAVLVTDGFLGPLIIGTLGGCGSMFLPFSKGLAGLDNGVPAGMETSFITVLLFHLISSIETVDPKSLRMLLCLHMVTNRIWPWFFEVNLYVPMRVVARAMTGIPNY